MTCSTRSLSVYNHYERKYIKYVHKLKLKTYEFVKIIIMINACRVCGTSPTEETDKTMDTIMATIMFHAPHTHHLTQI